MVSGSEACLTYPIITRDIQNCVLHVPGRSGAPDGGLIPSVTTALMAAISLFCIWGLMYGTYHGKILMIASKRCFFSTV